MTDEPASSALDHSIEVVRDVTFSRFVADEALVALVGRDLEVGFLQYGPMFRQQIDRGVYEETTSKNVVTEVARMRMDYATFLRMLMEFLEQGIVSGRIKAEAVQSSIAEWVTRAPSAQDATLKAKK